MRGRPRIDPQLRFRDVMPYWTIAHDARGRSPDKVLTIPPFPTENKAINVMHRLNMARAAMREHGVSDYDAYVVRRNGRHITIHHRPRFDPTGLLDGEGNPISSADIHAAIYSDPMEQQKVSNEDLRRFERVGDPNSLIERQIAWRHRHAEEQRLGIPVNDPNDPYPTEDEHTRIGLHEIDPKKPLLDPDDIVR